MNNLAIGNEDLTMSTLDVEGNNPTTPQSDNLNELLAIFSQEKSTYCHGRNGVQLSMEIKIINGFTFQFTDVPDKKGNHYLKITPDDFEKLGKQVQFVCTIKNTRTRENDPIIITEAGILHPFEAFSLTDPNGYLTSGKYIQVNACGSYSVIIGFKLKETHISDYKIPVYFAIQTGSKSSEMDAFFVTRSIIIAIQEKVPQIAKIEEKSPFTNNRWERVKMIPTTIRKKRYSRDQFPIPKKYFKTFIFGLKRAFEDGMLQEVKQKLEPGHVTADNYKDFFHILLWMEEVHCILGLSCYNMEDVRLAYLGANILELVVPGLAEKRPSVIKGDFIEIKIQNDHTSYQGVIYDVTDRTVKIEGLDNVIVEAVIVNPNMNIDVRFVLSRIHYERMHQGVEQTVSNGFVPRLFPSEELLTVPVSEPWVLSENSLMNKSIYNNKEQMTAVHKIINNTSNGIPYIVWGPPGTGKTVTIVEAIYQLKQSKKKILVCAPANAACNMLTEKLAAFCNETELTRILSDNADLQTVSENIIKYCNLEWEDGQLITVPFNRKKLNKPQIIVTTLVLAGRYTREYHPDYVFVDEAAQAREPEVCCALGLLLVSKNLILTGDPKQLGPVVYSTICKKYKYDISLLERLMDLPLYRRDVKTTNNFTTMLKMNFRSHSEIIKLPNQMFYDKQLQAMSRKAQDDPLAKTCIYKLIQNGGRNNKIGYPVEFCCVLAKEQKEGRSPSYYNPTEVTMVKKYVTTLINMKFPDSSKNVSALDIGVVTPYIRQVYKIREALRDYHDVEIGTAEAFQGREKRVIIISTVRAQEDLLLEDRKYKIGFVAEPKRFNVAITRAKSKVIVIGNPLILTKEEKWSLLINQAKEGKTLCGAPIPQRSDKEIEEITKRLKTFNIASTKKKENKNKKQIN